MWRAMADRKLRITQVRSASGRLQRHRRTLRALGIKRHQHTVFHRDTPAIRGMIARVDYLVEVTEVD